MMQRFQRCDKRPPLLCTALSPEKEIKTRKNKTESKKNDVIPNRAVRPVRNLLSHTMSQPPASEENQD